MSSSTNNGIIDQISSTVSNAANFVGEKLNQGSAEAKYEANKETAKDSNASIGDRVSAGVSAIGNKSDAKSSEAKAEGHKEMAKN